MDYFLLFFSKILNPLKVGWAENNLKKCKKFPYKNKSIKANFLQNRLENFKANVPLAIYL